jgi:hypothetical protein
MSRDIPTGATFLCDNFTFALEQYEMALTLNSGRAEKETFKRKNCEDLLYDVTCPYRLHAMKAYGGVEV